MKALALVLLSTAAFGQQRIGSVAMQDATVAGALEVTGGRAVLVGASSVTAKDHAAEVKLDRGGNVTICQTSGLHLSAGAGVGAPLMLALDRGAVEVHMNAGVSDAILTPDLRFALRGAGPVDLRIRVTRNGDTCVEHRGATAPTLLISDSFGEATYELHAGQHVLFEHGNLREVVDHETSPCGCPPVQTMSIAQASLSPQGTAEDHPFPAAVSAGLAPASEVPQATAGEVHLQVGATLTNDPDPAIAQATPVAAPAKAAVVAKPHGLGHAIGHFFHKLFGGSD